MKVKARVVITPDKVVVGEKILIFESSGADLLVEIYKKKEGNYPKFFKMDPLARLGFIASELLLGEETPRKTDCEMTLSIRRLSGKMDSSRVRPCSCTPYRTS